MVSTPTYWKCVEQLARGALRLARQGGVAVRRAREAQDAVAMHVEIEWIERDFAVGAAHGDDRHFGVEGHEVFVEQRLLAERVPGAIEVGRLAQHELALAVVAHAPGLEHAGQADRSRPRARGCARIDRRVLRGGNAEQFEGALFAEPVLRARRARAAAARCAPCRAGFRAPRPECSPSRR